MSLRVYEKQSPFKWNAPHSRRLLRQRAARNDTDNEILVDGAQNIWICQMGRKAEDGGFAEFVEKVSAAEIVFGGLNVWYQSPGNGLVRFGWEGPLSVEGVEIQLHDYPRYDNPYVRAEFDPREIRISAGDDELKLDWRVESVQ
jgi:hypothetical protein